MGLSPSVSTLIQHYVHSCGTIASKHIHVAMETRSAAPLTPLTIRTCDVNLLHTTRPQNSSKQLFKAKAQTWTLAL